MFAKMWPLIQANMPDREHRIDFTGSLLELLGAFESKGLRSTKFSATPALRGKAVAYARGNKTKARALITEKLSLDMKASEFISKYFGDERAA